jgi:hypothetical protein
MSIEAKFLYLQAIQNLLAPYRYLYCVDLEAPAMSLMSRNRQGDL